MDSSNWAPLNFSTSSIPIPIQTGAKPVFQFNNENLIAEFVKSMVTTNQIQGSTVIPQDLFRAQVPMTTEYEKAIEAQKLNQFHDMFRKPLDLSMNSINTPKTPIPLTQLQKPMEVKIFKNDPLQWPKSTNQPSMREQGSDDHLFKKPFDPKPKRNRKISTSSNAPPPIYTSYGPLSEFTSSSTSTNIFKIPNPNYEETKTNAPIQRKRKRKQDSPDLTVVYDSSTNRKLGNLAPRTQRRKDRIYESDMNITIRKESPPVTAPTCQQEYEKMVSQGRGMQMFATNEKEYEQLMPKGNMPQYETPQAIATPQAINTHQPMTAEMMAANLWKPALPAHAVPPDVKSLVHACPTLQILEDQLNVILKQHGIRYPEITCPEDPVEYPCLKWFFKLNPFANPVYQLLYGSAPTSSSPQAEPGSFAEAENKMLAEEQLAHQKLAANFTNWKFGECKKYVEVLHINTILKNELARVQDLNPYYINQEFRRLLELAARDIGCPAQAITSLMLLNTVNTNVALQFPMIFFDIDNLCIWLGRKVVPIDAKEHWLYTLPSIEQIKELMAEAIDNVKEELAHDCHVMMLKQVFASDWFTPVNNPAKGQRFKNMFELFPPCIMRMYQNALVEVQRLIKERKYYWSLDYEIPVIK